MWSVLTHFNTFVFDYESSAAEKWEVISLWKATFLYILKCYCIQITYLLAPRCSNFTARLQKEIRTLRFITFINLVKLHYIFSRIYDASITLIYSGVSCYIILIQWVIWDRVLINILLFTKIVIEIGIINSLERM